MSHRELGAAGEMGLPRLASSQALHGGAGSRRTWLGSLAQGCEVTPGLVPSLSSSLLGEMSRPVSAQHWLWEPPCRGVGIGSVSTGAQWPVFLSSATRFCFNRPRCRENGAVCRYVLLAPSYCSFLGPFCEWACSRLLTDSRKFVSAAVSSSQQSPAGVLDPVPQFVDGARSAI